MRYFSIFQPPSLLLTLLICLSFGALSAQGLMQKLGGIPTDFIIQSENDTLQVVDQYLINRAHSRRGSEYGFSYESFHFEFSALGQPLYAHVEGTSWGRISHEIFFLDAEGQSLGYFRQNLIGLRRIDDENTEGLYCYSLDLEGIPLINLQHCATIKIVAR